MDIGSKLEFLRPPKTGYQPRNPISSRPETNINLRKKLNTIEKLGVIRPLPPSHPVNLYVNLYNHIQTRERRRNELYKGRSWATPRAGSGRRKSYFASRFLYTANETRTQQLSRIILGGDIHKTQVQRKREPQNTPARSVGKEFARIKMLCYVLSVMPGRMQSAYT
ncbi:uncharacterized protein LOC111337486 isoform X1 [Stylophora pistillata]|uniref:uncharacterized protein LOC111337486 isoform X1 n=1 Tax=Stylophora pistillata TaxID=50429 RepID=UPI000C04AAE8|nr:uncharacterized protein LOC111337486 isoform X1 [Stylophora pistillata]XP_022799535.1 uncharacterized protein LOC111337486 isoform X1 [Stylophora pistillata]XP_022799536.1 uncharacterized protein LOC111337486 isoform X1 [Stylophora pistillata]